VEKIDFVKVFNVNAYTKRLVKSKKNSSTCVCGKSVLNNGRLMPMCACEIHQGCLSISWTLAPGFSKLYCPICKRNYYNEVFEQTPETEVMESAKKNFEQSIAGVEDEIMLKKTSNRQKKDEYPNENADTAD